MNYKQKIKLLKHFKLKELIYKDKIKKIENNKCNNLQNNKN